LPTFRTSSTVRRGLPARKDGTVTGRLEGKIAIVTGAARGIGRAVMRRYAAEGAVVYAADVMEGELEHEVYLLTQQGFSVHAVSTNLANEDEVQALAERALAEGRVDVLANVAGLIEEKLLEDTTNEIWNRILNVNLRAPFLLSRAVAPVMKRAKRGSIINVSSRAGISGFASETAYCASKFGLEGLSRALSKELEGYNIAVNTLTPGAPTHTSMSEITYTEELRKIWKEPSEITSAFVHLALQTPQGIHDQYVNAWELSEQLRKEGWEQ
jgi:NAD(P)-dependent dehydrogenase (short-subunit alcohol dehydrogenase family)